MTGLSSLPAFRQLWLGLLATLLLAAPVQAACRADVAEIRGDFGQVAFRVSVADSFAERARGLMFVEEMPRMSGMLFIYGVPQRVSFWMKNTLIPLDMIFLGPDGRIRRIHENAIPHDTTAIPGGPGILAVLEINGGMARKLGIDVGDALRHPGMPQEQAAWPCAE